LYTPGKLIYFDPFYFKDGNKSKPITKDGWSFPFHTMLYGNWLNDFPLELLSRNYPISGVDYEIMGDLTDAELKNVTDCFSNSATVKRKYKKWLQLP